MWVSLFWTVIGGVLIILASLTIYDRFFQKKNLVKGNYPLIGRFRYVAHDLRPFFRQYFGDDNAFAPRIIIDWILRVSAGKTGYWSYDKFDTTKAFHDGKHQMVHSATPLNNDEMNIEYPVIGEKRTLPLQTHSYIYRSAMSLGALSFEGTMAMAAGCADAKIPFNTGEGGLATHHIPRVKFSHDRKFFKWKRASYLLWPLYWMVPGARLKNYVIDWMGAMAVGSDLRDLYLFDKKHWVFYTIDWDAPLSAFPKPGELTEEFGNVIFQIGSGLYGLRAKTTDGSLELDWTRFKKTASFARAIEIKLAQGAKQSGGILKGGKNTPTIAAIRGVKDGIDLISQNRFPFYEPGGEKEFLEFMERASEESGGKPIGMKIVISDESNIEPIAQAIKVLPKTKGPDFITLDGGDGGTGAAPLQTSILFGKKAHDAIPVAVDVLEKHGVRDRVKLFASSKLYSPESSARALALGADMVGNARSVMIAAGCIRAGLCSGEYGDCPVGLATMKKSKRRAYAVAIDAKIENVKNYLTAHNHGLELVAAICGVTSPHLLDQRHIAKPPKC